MNQYINDIIKPVTIDEGIKTDVPTKDGSITYIPIATLKTDWEYTETSQDGRILIPEFKTEAKKYTFVYHFKIYNYPGIGDNPDIKDGLKDVKDDCAICHDNMYDGQNIVQLPCNHIFHSNCINPWPKDSCPLCRTTFTREDINMDGKPFLEFLHEYIQNTNELKGGRRRRHGKSNCKKTRKRK
jgi:hypothetical protein